MSLFFKKNIGWVTLAILTIIPAIRWLFLMPVNFRFFGIDSTMTSFGQIAGLTGLTMFSLNLILAGRFKFLDYLFYGLNITYNWHRIVGTLSFSFLLFHPLLLAISYSRLSWRSAALFLLPFTNELAITFGIFALLGMIILIVLTYYARIKYQNWKISHKFMVLVFMLALLHAWLIQSDIARDPFLRFYIFSLAGLGLASGFYRAFLSKYWNNNLLYEVKNFYFANPLVLDIEMAPRRRSLAFKAGQFIFVRFLKSQVSSESHPFSLSSSPGEANLKITIKSLGDYTSALKDLSIGDIAAIEGPFGRFIYHEASLKNQIWLAGGIGITPFLSMARELKDQSYKIDLYYCLKDQAEAVFMDELSGLSRQNKNLKIIPWYSSGQGRISGQAVKEASRGLTDKEIFLCGPIPFMENLNKQFRALGVKRGRIYFEKFNLK